MGVENQFKKVRRKDYEAWVCKPPVGSCILSPNFSQGNIIGVPDFVICIHGEMYKITANELFFNYVNADGTRITYDTITDNAYICRYSTHTTTQPTSQHMMSISQHKLSGVLLENGETLVPTTLTYKQALKSKHIPREDLIKRSVLKWTKVICKSPYQDVALLIKENDIEHRRLLQSLNLSIPSNQPSNHNPKNNQSFNKPPYFLVGTMTNNQLIPQSCHILTSSAFAYAYDCRAFKNVVTDKAEQSRKPQELFILEDYVEDKKCFSDILGVSIQNAFSSSIGKQYNFIFDLNLKRVNDNCIRLEFSSGFENNDYVCFAYRRKVKASQSVNQDHMGYFFSVQLREAVPPQFMKDDSDSVGKLKDYFRFLEKNKYILINTNNYQEFKDLVLAYLNMTDISALSNYYTSKLSISELTSLKEYSGQEYKNINSYLRGTDCPNPFQAYLHAMFITDILDRSYVCKDIYHFRGLTIQKDMAKNIKEGYQLESKGFLSSSISSIVASSFGVTFNNEQKGYMLVFKNTNMQHGFYLENISNHRGSEFEILYNLNYDIKFIKQLGYYNESITKDDRDSNNSPCCECWYVELVQVQDRKIQKYQYKKDAVEKLIYAIQSDRKLMQHFYIAEVSEGMLLETINTSSQSENTCVSIMLKMHNISNLSILLGYESKGTNEFLNITFKGLINDSKSVDITNHRFNDALRYIHGVLHNNRGIKFSMTKNDLSLFSERFMLDLSNLFLSNNFIVINQDINKKTRGLSEDASFEFGSGLDMAFASLDSLDISESGEIINNLPIFSNQSLHDDATEMHIISSFSIVQANLKPLEFEVEIYLDDQDIKVELTTSSKSDYHIHQKFKGSIKKRQYMFELVYDWIIKKFHLDCTRRLKRILSLVSGFYESELKLESSGQHSYIWYVDNKEIIISLWGTQISVNNPSNTSEISFDYFTSIYKAAELIQTII